MNSAVVVVKLENALLTNSYTLKAGEKPNAVVVYYLNEEGKITTQTGIYDAASKAVILRLTHFSKYVVGYNKINFTDVAATASYAESVNFVTARGLFGENRNGVFNPTGKMTKAMFAKVLANLEGVDLSTYKTSPFSDVAVNSEYNAVISWAAQNGIFKGKKFYPNKEMTHEQMAVMLNNYIKYKGYVLSTVSNKTFADME